MSVKSNVSHAHALCRLLFTTLNKSEDDILQQFQQRIRFRSKQLSSSHIKITTDVKLKMHWSKLFAPRDDIFLDTPETYEHWIHTLWLRCIEVWISFELREMDKETSTPVHWKNMFNDDIFNDEYWEQCVQFLKNMEISFYQMPSFLLSSHAKHTFTQYRTKDYEKAVLWNLCNNYWKETTFPWNDKQYYLNFSAGLKHMIVRGALWSPESVMSGIGQGVQVTKRIPENTEIAIYGGEKAVVKRSAIDFDSKDQAYLHATSLPDGSPAVITSVESSKHPSQRHFSTLINHQWQIGANVNIQYNRKQSLPTLVSIRNIAKNEFLYWDYGVPYWMASLLGYKEFQFMSDVEIILFSSVIQALLPNIAMFDYLKLSEIKLFRHFWLNRPDLKVQYADPSDVVRLQQTDFDKIMGKDPAIFLNQLLSFAKEDDVPMSSIKGSPQKKIQSIIRHPKCRFSEEMINRYGQILIKSQHPQPFVQFIASWIFDSVFFVDDKQPQKMMNNTKNWQKAKQWLLFPKVRNNHWVLFVIDLSSHHVDYFNSSLESGGVEEDIKDWSERMKHFHGIEIFTSVSLRFSDEDDKHEEKHVETFLNKPVHIRTDMPQQEGDVDCGVYVMEVMRQYVLAGNKQMEVQTLIEPILDFTAQDIPAIREGFSQSLSSTQ